MHTHERASALTSYGIYLAALGKTMEAENAIRESMRLNPSEVLAYASTPIYWNLCSRFSLSFPAKRVSVVTVWFKTHTFGYLQLPASF